MGEESKRTTFADFKGEFKKIDWPTKKELVKQSITVMITCVIIALFIFVMDMGVNEAVSLFTRFFG